MPEGKIKKVLSEKGLDSLKENGAICFSTTPKFKAPVSNNSAKARSSSIKSARARKVLARFLFDWPNKPSKRLAVKKSDCTSRALLDRKIEGRFFVDCAARP